MTLFLQAVKIRNFTFVESGSYSYLRIRRAVEHTGNTIRCSHNGKHFAIGLATTVFDSSRELSLGHGFKPWVFSRATSELDLALLCFVRYNTISPVIDPLYLSIEGR